ncbi:MULTISPECIES: chemotaxis protein CheD [Methylomonas]|uniref:Probable chemoreceptor glutamine deamidase CheD n=1 Tax=Methylomonas koyamae TaxID=702114 RepID=A0AA91DC22_9GAMM|nr:MULTISPECIES: chemotaxis protein CheD [Methylomonas]ANE55404.1 chemotaxis protein CheD [Methylomonas sp. DH-1]OAI25330.1 chemotaxis protein CheD [Methylomonas koyamae]WNB77844.1 chemotaxis protein CheD [Methylomonas koyamae]BBL58434.1 putative chemoreceptor glutamine deamidase CheD 1 [Methylomonas koyamae]
MKILPYKGTRRIILDPGEYYASRQAEVISTLLGSCVAACLYDPDNGVFGMNHFLLAYRRNPEHLPLLQSEEGRYGIFAMELLINQMMKLGADRHKLKAKCFGGGNVLHLRENNPDLKSVGDVNVLFIKQFLHNEHIPLVGAGLGGNIGRNVHFVGEDYSVYVKKIDTAQQQWLERAEQRYWQKNIEERERQHRPAEFW